LVIKSNQKQQKVQPPNSYKKFSEQIQEIYPDFNIKKHNLQKQTPTLNAKNIEKEALMNKKNRNIEKEALMNKKNRNIEKEGLERLKQKKEALKKKTYRNIEQETLMNLKKEKINDSSSKTEMNSVNFFNEQTEIKKINHFVKSLLRNKESLKKAFLLKEILDKREY